MSSLSSSALHAVFDALSHFDPATHGEVTYREEPFGTPDWEDFWSKSGWFHLRNAGIKAHSSDYDVPIMFHMLSDDDCWKVISFVENHRESFWALDAIRSAVVDQALSRGFYNHLVSNVAFLWDRATSRAATLSRGGDCYSYRVVRGLPDVEISRGSASEQVMYRALVDFVLVSYIRSHCTATASTAPVREDSPRNMMYAQDPYLSIVMQHPEQLEVILRWEEMTDGKPDEIDKLIETLQQGQSSVLAQGML